MTNRMNLNLSEWVRKASEFRRPQDDGPFLLVHESPVTPQANFNKLHWGELPRWYLKPKLYSDLVCMRGYEYICCAMSIYIYNVPNSIGIIELWSIKYLKHIPVIWLCIVCFVNVLSPVGFNHTVWGPVEITHRVWYCKGRRLPFLATCIW